MARTKTRWRNAIMGEEGKLIGIIESEGHVGEFEEILFIDVDTIKRESVLDENVSDDAIRNALIFVQDYIVMHIIGASLYNRLAELISSGLIYDKKFDQYHTLLSKYLRPVFIHGVPANIVISNAYKTRNIGTFQIDGDSNKKASTLAEIKYVQQDYNNKMDFYSQRAVRYLGCNCECFPELCSCSCDWYQASFASKQPSLPINLVRGHGSDFDPRLDVVRYPGGRVIWKK